MTTGQRMMGYLPRLYERSRVMEQVIGAQGAELDVGWAAVADILAQHLVQTATWGVDLWEEELGLTPDPSQAIADRRSRVLGRLRGHGTVTIKLLKQVAEAYDRGRVSVVADYPASTMIIRFVDTGGVPPNLADLEAELRKLVPADYDVVFLFKYLTWSELDARNLTWDQLDAMGLTWDELEVWI